MRRILVALTLVAGLILGAPAPAQAGTDWTCVYAAAPGTNPGLCIEVRRYVNQRGKLVVEYIASHEAMTEAWTDFFGTLTIRNNNRKVRWRILFSHADGQTPRAWQTFTRIKTRYGWARLTGDFTADDGTVASINRAWRIG